MIIVQRWLPLITALEWQPGSEVKERKQGSKEARKPQIMRGWNRVTGVWENVFLCAEMFRIVQLKDPDKAREPQTTCSGRGDPTCQRNLFLRAAIGLHPLNSLGLDPI
ncbi:hypothetical protein EYF80_033316 [Liparis tanakae]|uniref:Uncharacterized protein n=1 Tax=Liparis tanakae TaxID=230148 RepID=A0A4Z2GSG9_9TELE|nr:hypothetical protein EYF80_033316 [Liparis tanakae]